MYERRTFHTMHYLNLFSVSDAYLDILLEGGKMENFFAPPLTFLRRGGGKKNMCIILK